MDETVSARDWLILARAPGFGAATWRKIMAATRIRDAASLLGRSAADLRELGIPGTTAESLACPDREALEKDLAWLEASPRHHFVPLPDPRYPPRLREIADAPLALFVVGDLDLLDKAQIAIVGSRNPTAGGRRTAHAFSRHLASSGLAITSGLAEGIDAAAHDGALAGAGMTLAIMGTGPDRVYPAVNRGLAQRIAEHGLLLTEFPPGTEPRPGHFPRRNRIMAGLSLGTLVVEAAEKSGSLITARLAGEYGREVFAIPGSIHNPLARGCHRLIRQGAKLVETAADILEELAPQLAVAAAPSTTDTPAAAGEQLAAEYRQLLDVMGFDPVGIDALVAATGLTAQEVSSMLLILELEGHVSASPGGRYSRNHAKNPI